MRFAFRTFLLLYPAPYRNMFGREMASVFEQAADDLQPRGFLAYCMFLGGEFASLIAGAFSVWADEYLSRSRRRLTASFVMSLVAGTAVAALTQGCFLAQMGHLGRLNPGYVQTADTPQAVAARTELLLLASGTLIFVSLFALAFVWNMRSIEIRAGRLKPIRMPGRAENARIARRDQTVYRNSNGERCELHCRGRRGDRLSGAERLRQIYNPEDDHRAD